MKPTLILAGVSGDLATRKLLPALQALAQEGQIPFERVIGTARRQVDLDKGALGEALSVRQLDIGNAEHVAELAEDAAGDVIVYLSLPPGTVPAAARALAQGGLGHARLVVEKPFGFDAESAKRESIEIGQYFSEEQLYRVDHFLFKPFAQDVRGKAANANHIEVFASEDSTIGQRADFYEKTGALRDFGNHLLSIAMQALGGRSLVPQLRLMSAARAQYEGYADEIGKPSSETETFFILELICHDTKVILASGKGLEEKKTIVCIDGANEYNDVVDRAYQQVLLAVARGERDKFLSLAEVLESWRLMDQARERWGKLNRYPRGAKLDEMLKTLRLE